MERRCSNLGPTQSRISPRILQYKKRIDFGPICKSPVAAKWLSLKDTDIDCYNPYDVEVDCYNPFGLFPLRSEAEPQSHDLKNNYLPIK